MLTVKDVGVLRPQLVESLDDCLVAAMTTTGRLLIFPVNELPQLPRGKGIKLLNISPAKCKFIS